MNKPYDLLIVGAGPAGIYLGWLMAKKGKSILILERDSRESVGSKMDQFHMDTFAFEEFGVPPPALGNDEYITSLETTIHYSPKGNYPQKMKWGVIAMRFQLFVRRLINLSEKEGVNFQFSSQFKSNIFQDKKLIGIIIEKDGNEMELYGRVIVDASGTSAVVRRSLPNEYGVETFKIEDDEKMYVIQRVIRWQKPDEPHPGIEAKSITWMYYKHWIAPHFISNANIFGNGQPRSFQNAEKANKIFLENMPFPPFEILEEHRATTVYRRLPYSLVGDAFFCLGDSACMTKPFNGEGVALSWAVSRIASEVLDDALQNRDYISKEKLWEINVKYFRDYGAKCSALLAQIPVAANTTKNDMEFLFKKEIIFSAKAFEDMNNYYELQIGLGGMIKILGVFLWGIITRQFSKKTLGTMLKYMKISNKIRKHYEMFPENSKDFDEWVVKADELWSPVEKMKFTLFN
ncbi:MAG: NAD(P)/FAD-dependent oxidoreductase [Candidatus Hermodarchaeota archaeon]